MQRHTPDIESSVSRMVIACVVSLVLLLFAMRERERERELVVNVEDTGTE
jgi:hypothetical protein